MKWWQKSVFYQIYPLGFCGAERENDFSEVKHRLWKIEEAIPSIVTNGFGAVLLNPFLKASRHGYDTADFRMVDNRLGDNADFERLSKKFHEAGIRLVADGVFNHVGRDFFAFKDVRENRERSPYRDWFARIDFGGNSCYGDGFWYEGWEGHYDLVKLNLSCPAVKDYLFESLRMWITEFGIDGLRLDVGYLLPEWFVRELSGFARSLKEDFFIVAEMIHGDYNRLLNSGCDSVTNYECYKGLYSAINSKNLFEIEHSLSRQFADTQWALYKGRQLMSFLDNHDVPRIYSILNDKRNVEIAYSVLMFMPGIPCVYYGSEYGAEGVKGDGDAHLRPAFDDINKAAHPSLTETIGKLARLRPIRKSLCVGGYHKVILSNEYFLLERFCEGERTLLAVNISDCIVKMNVGEGLTDLMSSSSKSGEVALEGHSFLLLGN